MRSKSSLEIVLKQPTITSPSLPRRNIGDLLLVRLIYVDLALDYLSMEKWFPIVDHTVVVDRPLERFLAGKHHDIPVIIGTTELNGIDYMAKRHMV